MALQVAVLVLLEANAIGRPPAGSRHQALLQLSQERVFGMSALTKHAVSHAAMPMHISAMTTVTGQV